MSKQQGWLVVGCNPKDWLAGWLAGQLAGWLVEWLTGWLAVGLAGWLADELANWLADQLAYGCMRGWHTN